LSPDGNVVALISACGTPDLRRWPDDSPVPLSASSVRACAVAFSPDGALFAASTKDALDVWRISDGALVRQIPELARAHRISLSTAGDVIGVVLQASPVDAALVWRLADPSNIGTVTISHPPRLADATSIIDVAVSPDGAHLAAMIAGRDGLSQTWAFIDAWTTADGALVWSNSYGVYTDFDPWNRLIFSRDGTRLAALEPLGQLAVLDAATGSRVRQSALVVPWMFSADGTTIAGMSFSGGGPALCCGPALVRVYDGVVTGPGPLPDGATFAGVGVGPSPSNSVRAVYRSPTALVYAESGTPVGSH